MSHIPSAAMPHAKPHEPAPPAPPAPPPPARQAPMPWAALAAGGVLAIGGAITAALLLRRGGTRPAPRKASTRKAAATKSSGKPRKTRSRRTKTAGDDA